MVKREGSDPPTSPQGLSSIGYAIKLRDLIMMTVLPKCMESNTTYGTTHVDGALKDAYRVADAALIIREIKLDD